MARDILGEKGSTLATVGAPDPTLGNNGDTAIDHAAGILYGPKANGVWPPGTVLKAGGGLIAIAELAVKPADLVNTSAFTDIPGLSINVNTGGGKLIKVGFNCVGVSISTTAAGIIQIQEDGVAIMNISVTNTNLETVERLVFRTPSSGVHTYKAAWRGTGTTTLSMWATVAPIAQIWAEYA